MKKIILRFITAIMCILMLLCYGCTMEETKEPYGVTPLTKETAEKLQKNMKKLKADFPEATVSIDGKEVVMTKTVDFDTVDLPVNEHDAGTYRSFDNWDSEFSLNRLDKDYIVQVKKVGSSKQITRFNENMLCTRFYSETPVQVEKVFYGDMEVGINIMIHEEAAILTDTEGKEAIQTYGTPLVKSGQSYLMILQKWNIPCSDGGDLYIYNNHSRIFPIDETVINAKGREALLEALGSQKQNGLTDYDRVYADLMEKYIYSPDLRLDEEQEMRKMLTSIAYQEGNQKEIDRLLALRNNKSATKEQLSAELSSYQKDLLERMCKKYGTLESAAVKE